MDKKIENNKNLFRPFKGMNNITFGLKREIVRKLIIGDFHTFLRNKFAENTTDYYRDLGLFINYNKDDECEAIEITSKGNLFFEKKNLFDYSVQDIREKFDSLSENMEEEAGNGVTYYDLGFGFSIDEEDHVIDWIIIFSQEYWLEG